MGKGKVTDLYKTERLSMVKMAHRPCVQSTVKFRLALTPEGLTLNPNI